ncbi:CvpA family protein [Porphyrobacter algicida]|uniref:CvpA family protein n=1 Tax=Qipengyuania algicida TaxID=1836209 RepID=A0A845AHQ7_9SPHN|nr:CvpA family protein [Qipengyuania algicida]MXP28451.1 CvpA family protein [Qipengyuania algicida]
MTGFDFIVLGVIAVAATGGFMRGFLQEVLSLAAWILVAFAIRYLHTPMTEWLGQYLGYTMSVSLLAFAMLLLIPYAAMKVIANNVGRASRASILGPIDRVLGFGFGALKGMLIVVIAFSLIVLGYDNVWSFSGRPTWITNARSYEFVDASSRSLVQILQERRARLQAADDKA